MTASVDNAGRRRASARRRPTLAILVLGGPFAVLFLATYVLPLAYALARSLTQLRRSGLGFGQPQTVFVGLANYVQVWTSSTFWTGTARVVLYTVVQVPVMLVVALGLALLLDSVAAHFVPAYRFVYFLPYAIPGVVASLLWAYLYVPQLSPIVQGLHHLGWQIDLLGQRTVLFSMANITIWTYTGYNVIIYLSSLRSISPDLYDSARLDGAGEWRIARAIKVPLIRGTMVLTILFSLIGSMQLFSEPTILRTVTRSISSDWVPMMMAYNQTFAANNFEYGSAISVTIALLAGLVATAYYRLSLRRSR